MVAAPAQMHGYPEYALLASVVEGTERGFIALAAVSLHLGAEFVVMTGVGR
jgi:hypothetical protein